MASQRGPPSPALVATSTGITAIGDDLLCEIFIRLPPSSLVRAALACTFLLRIHSLVPLDGRSDQDLAAAIQGSGFRFIRLPIPKDRDDSRWEILHGCRCRCGYVLLCDKNTNQMAAYNPLKRELYTFPYPPQETRDPHCLDFRITFCEDDQSSFRVVCVQQELARFSVFSSEYRSGRVSLGWTMERQFCALVLHRYSDGRI
ncbi:hypothetical protein ZWY2020_036852 [Hordeum vulgare]|nr:hypothetical protein ZWY2020_036852 [Hordeum vulgare]